MEPHMALPFPMVVSGSIPGLWHTAYSVLMYAFIFTQYTNSLAKSLVFFNAHMVAV